MDNLSAHFTLAELTASDWAERNGVDNTPAPNILENLKRLANKLEEVRSLLDKPLTISSAFRNTKVNKAAGSKPTSSHVQGLAADLKCPQYGKPQDVCQAIADSDIQFDQLILEFPTPEGKGWVHIAINGKNRRQVLTINKHGVYAGIHV